MKHCTRLSLAGAAASLPVKLKLERALVAGRRKPQASPCTPESALKPMRARSSSGLPAT
jgi:hypothetical protein